MRCRFFREATSCLVLSCLEWTGQSLSSKKSRISCVLVFGEEQVLLLDIDAGCGDFLIIRAGIANVVNYF